MMVGNGVSNFGNGDIFHNGLNNFKALLSWIQGNIPQEEVKTLNILSIFYFIGQYFGK